MDRSIVIKVKYGDTRRRFGSHVSESGQLDLDIEKLRDKVVGFFNFTPDVDLTLTYVDEDGDVVSLVDDVDLADVVQQSLNPLLVNVLVNTEKGSGSHARSNGISTQIKLCQFQQAFPFISRGAAEILTLAPEPLRESISKLLCELFKAMSSDPVPAEELASFVSKFPLNSDYGTQLSTEPCYDDMAYQNHPLSSVSTGLRDSVDGGNGPEVLPDAKNGVTAAENIQQGDIGNIVESPLTPVDLNIPLDCAPDVCATSKAPARISDVLAGESEGSKNGHKSKHCGKIVDFGVHEFSDGYKWSAHLDNIVSQCPFSGLPLSNDLTTRPASYPHLYLKKGTFEHKDNTNVFHRHVRCDGCGVHPIIGPRFKSKVKLNYDLCSGCFSELGNEDLYIRMDRPASYLHPWKLKGSCDPARSHHLKGRMKQPRAKLNSRFVLDVNFMDGTVMAPSTKFLKIWRMRNNGTTVWPKGTELVWIGGVKMSEEVSINVKVPFLGVPVDSEVDIGVSFKAPELPGRYVSYWRMSLPSGQKFGQRVWVLIQVDRSLNEPLCDTSCGLNLNLPPESSGCKHSVFIDTEARPLVDCRPPEPLNPDAAIESAELVVAKQTLKDQEMNFPINDSLLVGNDGSHPIIPFTVSSLEPYPDFADIAPATVFPEQSLVSDALVSPERTHVNNDVEESMLRELEEMGFKQVGVNKEILRMNEFDLEQSVCDLCELDEWDPILQELEEMGFSDTDVNRKLLKKNNGSIMRVVMDLIADEKSNA